jgi:nucleotide-binding universal stress UspA family protein
MMNIVALVDPEDGVSQEKVLPTAIDYARHKGAQLHVLTVVPDDMYKMSVVVQVIPEGYEDRLLDDARERLGAVVARQDAADVEIEQHVRLGSVYREALRFSQEIDADLIVMGAHKAGLQDYLLGSNASQIVRHAGCAVWVVRE